MKRRTKTWKLVFIVVFPVIALPIADWWWGYFAKHFSIGVAQKVTYCLPWRLFFITKHFSPDEMIGRGDIVTFTGDHRMPEAFRKHNIVKMVLGVPGDEIRIADRKVFVNGEYFDRLWLLEGENIEIPEKTILLGENEYFLVGTTRESFDSRYFGPVRRDSFIGRAIPLM